MEPVKLNDFTFRCLKCELCPYQYIQITHKGHVLFSSRCIFHQFIELVELIFIEDVCDLISKQTDIREFGLLLGDFENLQNYEYLRPPVI